MGEALERLCMELFMNNGNVLPNEVLMCCEDIPMSSEFLEEGDAVTTFIEKYEEFKADARNGKCGKTAKFWAVYYMDVLSNIIQIHHAVQTNDFGLQLDRLKKALPFCFALNKQNYARYGTIYVRSLANIETMHPGFKKLLLNKGVSVQAQSRYPLRMSIDQHGEQTIETQKPLVELNNLLQIKNHFLNGLCTTLTKLGTHKLCMKWLV